MSLQQAKKQPLLHTIVYLTTVQASEVQKQQMQHFGVSHFFTSACHSE